MIIKIGAILSVIALIVSAVRYILGIAKGNGGNN